MSAGLAAPLAVSNTLNEHSNACLQASASQHQLLSHRAYSTSGFREQMLGTDEQRAFALHAGRKICVS